jgi:hypothetical protein
MTAKDLLAELTRRRVSIKFKPPDSLKLRPKSALDRELLDQLRQHKAEIIALIIDPVRDRALADPMVKPFIEAFDAEVVEAEDLSKPKLAWLGIDDLPELQARLESNGWKVTRRDDELICVPGPKTETPALPTSRCRACKSWAYWVSGDGVVVCATCHPPANLKLVAHWYTVPEGEQAGRIQ